MKGILCTIEQGTLKGQEEKNISGGLFYSFVGIPYAKPPLGKLRFKSPQPPESWDGVRDATEEGDCCHSLQLIPTSEALMLKPTGSEDCLFLNVYTCQLPEKNQNSLKPVMVFIHGGAFTTGSSKRILYGPEFLMTENIILVTINYRLGALGFLTIDDPSLGVTGNAGLKDQVQALIWVQKNIKNFGGDPNNVTIFGESAGGASVHYLVLSPLARGLFHKAIVQSASVLCPWARGVNNAQKLAEILGFNETDNSKILDFLQQIPVEKLLEGQVQLGDWLSPGQKRNFGPTIEPKTEHAFLTEDPIKLIKRGDYNKVPMIFGYTDMEGILLEGSQLFGFQIHDDDFIPYYFGLTKDSTKYCEIHSKIVEYYYKNERVDTINKNAFYLVMTDTTFLRPIHLAVKAHVETSDKPVYYYRMSVDTDLNIVKKMIADSSVKGACHGDDLGYLFKMDMSGTLKEGSIEDTTVRRFVKMWTNFARTGQPVPVTDALLNVNWKPVTEHELHFVDIGSELVSGTNPDIDRMNLWDQISQGIQEVY